VATTSTDSGRPQPGITGEGEPRRGRKPPTGASERRAHLVRLAADLFSQKGFQATTVRNIAEEAGILSGSLYHHFDSKESIVDEILTGFLTDITTTYRSVVAEGRNPRSTLMELVRVAFGSLEPHRAAVTVLQNDWNHLRGMERFAYLDTTEAEIEELWAQTITAGQRQGMFRADIEPALTYRMIRDSVWATVRWFRPDERLDTRALAEHYLKVVFDGIATR
jgi:TetR/AcrR family transcriptional regulator, cholesterol catabolism regulator